MNKEPKLEDKYFGNKDDEGSGGKEEDDLKLASLEFSGLSKDEIE